jgi:hypothetical protein
MEHATVGGMNTPSSNPPSIARNSFSCPHCGAYSLQTWFGLYASKLPNEGTPTAKKNALIELIKSKSDIEEQQQVATLSRVRAAQPKLVPVQKVMLDFSPPEASVSDIYLSCCFACKQLAVWVFDAVVSPFNKDGPPHHSEMPEDIARDYDEGKKGRRSMLPLQLWWEKG